MRERRGAQARDVLLYAEELDDHLLEHGAGREQELAALDRPERLLGLPVAQQPVVQRRVLRAHAREELPIELLERLDLLELRESESVRQFEFGFGHQWHAGSG